MNTWEGIIMTARKALIIFGDIWRCYCLSKNAMNIAKGVVAGVATGVLVGYAGSKMMKKNPKQMKKNAGKAINAMGDFISGVSAMFK